MLVIIVLLLISFTGCISDFKNDKNIIEVVSVPKDCLKIFFTTDWQDADLIEITKDINNIVDVNIMINLGDLVNSPKNKWEWDRFHYHWDNTVGIGNITFKNYVHGNHEGVFWSRECDSEIIKDFHWNPQNHSRNADNPNWIYKYNNLVFIALPLAYMDCLEGENVFGIGEEWLRWFNSTVQKYKDDIIIVCCHLGLETGRQENLNGLWEQDDIYWILDRYDVRLWVHGHTHKYPSCVQRNNTFYLHAGKANYPQYNSIMLCFKNNSSIVDLYIRHHIKHSWTSKIGEYEKIDIGKKFVYKNNN